MKQALTSSRRFTKGPAAAAAAYNRPYGKEIKTVDVQLAGNYLASEFNPIVQTFSTNESGLLLNGIQQGAADFQRVGRHVNLKSLRIRGNITTSHLVPAVGTTNYQEQVIRLVVVHIKSEETAIPTWDAVFGGVMQTGGSIVNRESSVLPYKLGDVTVLRDVTLKSTANNCGDIATGGDWLICRLPFDEYIPLKGLQTVYKGTNNPVTIAHIATGAIVLYMRAAYNTTDDHAAINDCGVARLRYEDH